MEYYFFIPIFIVIFCIALYLILKPIFRDKKARVDVTNFDGFMGSYIFLLKESQEETISILKIKNVQVSPEYSLDDHNLSITFTHLGAKLKYQLSFVELDKQTYLKVCKTSLLHNKSNIPYMVNSFFINKLDAVPVDYSFFVAKTNS